MMLARSRVLTGLALIALTGFGLVAAEKNERVTRTKAAVEERMRRDITFLASDQCEGRGVSTKGINLAADYIAAEFKKAGIKPAAKNPDYFQSFSIVTGNAKLEEPNSLHLRGPLGQAIELKLGDQFIPVGLSDSGKVKADIVFVGYGATANGLHYDCTRRRRSCSSMIMRPPSRATSSWISLTRPTPANPSASRPCTCTGRSWRKCCNPRSTSRYVTLRRTSMKP
jgi:hypothetical protein